MRSRISSDDIQRIVMRKSFNIFVYQNLLTNIDLIQDRILTSLRPSYHSIGSGKYV